MKQIHNFYPKTHLLQVFIFSLLTLFTSLFIQVSTPQVADAWCSLGLTSSSSNVEDNTQCAMDNWDSIPHDASDGTSRRGMSYEEYMKAIDACAGDTAGVDAEETTCANAISNCLQTSVVVSLCSNAEKMADVASLSCNYGTTFNCDDINESNQEQIDKAQNDAIAQARNTCDMTGVDMNSVNAIAARQDECEKRYLDEMSAQGCAANFSNLNNAGHRYNEIQDGIDKGSDCMQGVLKSTAQTSKECSDRGGIWMDQDYNDPVAGSNSDVSRGCKGNYSDLINQDACEAGGGKWGQTGGLDTSKTQDDVYGCMDPEKGTPDNQNGDEDSEPDAAAPGVNGSSGPRGNCGTAKVNLLVCGEETGNVAISNVLRIVIVVLSVGIGVAAVGGLAWASILYAKAEDNASSVSEARELIRNIVIGILLYGFLVAIINWLVPGGVFT